MAITTAISTFHDRCEIIFVYPNTIFRSREPGRGTMLSAVQSVPMGSTATTHDYIIECPLAGEGSKLVRDRPEGLDVSVRFEEGGDHVELLPRFLGDHCEFVPRAADYAGDLRETVFCSTACPMHPGAEDVHACFLTRGGR